MKKFPMPAYVRFIEGEGESPAPSNGESVDNAESSTDSKTSNEPIQLPDDHPLVKTLATLKEENKNLRGRSAKLAEIEDANKSELERATEKASEAEKRAADAEARALRREVALDAGLSKDDAAFLDALTDEDAMRALAERLAKAAEQKQDQRSGVGFHMDQTGRDSGSTPNQDEIARAFFGI